MYEVAVVVVIAGEDVRYIWEHFDERRGHGLCEDVLVLFAHLDRDGITVIFFWEVVGSGGGGWL